MTAISQFYKDNGFTGLSETFATPTWARWQWIKFGSALGNEISSFRTNTVEGRGCNVFGFANANFTGRFASLNVPPGWTCWWSSLGGFNDDIESALILRRDSKEIVQPLNDVIVPDFIAEFDEQTAGTQAKRNGSPSVFSLYFPSHDPGNMFVSIEQNLVIELDCWWDYDAQVRFDVQFQLVGGKIDAFVKWVYVWVEGGIFSGDIFDELQPKMVGAAPVLTGKIRQKLALLNLGAALAGYKFGNIYLLPGRKPGDPPTEYGRLGQSNEDCCVVVTRID